MPSLITKRGKKRWRACVRLGRLERQKLFPEGSKRSERAAMRWEEKTRTELGELARNGAGVAYPEIVLVDWVDSYLDHVQETQSLATLREKKTSFRRLAAADGVSAGVSVASLTVPVAYEHLRTQARERSGYAANKDRKNLAHAWEWGTKYMEGFPRQENPFRAVDKFPEIRQPRYIPPEEDFDAVYDLAEGQDQLILLAASHLAARRGELWRLKWSDVDFAQARIRLWTHKRQGGNLESDWLPMSGALKAGLLGWREQRLAMDQVDKEHVFVCLDVKRANTEYYGQRFKVRRQFMASLCKRAGVKPFGLHAIRHMAATLLYREGYDVAHIQQVLRHRNPNTTTRYLRGLGLEQVRGAIEEGLAGKARVIPFAPAEKKSPRKASSEG